MKFPLRTLSVLTALSLAGTALPAFAETVLITATLSGTDEVPANDSPGMGTVDGTYDTESNVFAYRIDYSGLSGEATAAHFHGPAAPGATAPPSVPIDGTLASPIVGTATLSDSQESELLGGMWYFNVHTAQYPDGEIRGQLVQSMTSSMMSTESSMMSSEEPSSEMSSELSSEMSSASSELSSVVSSVSSQVSSAASDVSSAVSSAVSDVSSAVSSALDPSVSVSASVDASADVSVSAP